MTNPLLTSLQLHCQLDRPENAISVKSSFDLPGITALFGPNGCGKTTLLRIIAGLEKTARGTITLGHNRWQTDKNSLAPHKRNIGLVFQDTRLFEHLTIAGNLAFAEKRRNNNGPEINRHDVIKTFALEELLDKKPATLSGGERQRVAIARALLSRPQLLLMDEPLSALDIHLRSRILNYIEAIPAKFGIPILLVTHALDEVARLADNIVLMKKGQIIAHGQVEEILSRLDLAPLTGRFEASTLLSGFVGQTDEKFSLTTIHLDDEHGNQMLTVPSLSVPKGQKVRLRIRARDVALATKEPRGISIRNILRATITEIAAEPDTAFAEILLDVDGQHLRTRITRASLHELNLAVGNPVLALVKSIAMDRRLVTTSTKRKDSS